MTEQSKSESLKLYIAFAEEVVGKPLREMPYKETIRVFLNEKKHWDALNCQAKYLHFLEKMKGVNLSRFLISQLSFLSMRPREIDEEIAFAYHQWITIFQDATQDEQLAMEGEMNQRPFHFLRRTE